MSSIASNTRIGTIYLRPAMGLTTLALVFATAGCGETKRPDLRSLERYGNGYTVVLPGIEGKSFMNADIAEGLAKGGYPGAIEIYDWTPGGVFTWAVNLRYESRNRREASRIARKVCEYQDNYPGKPVHIIGHSGGGALAVYVLEALPRGRQVTSALLLAPALSPDYNLTRALSRVEESVWNFYSMYDVGLLGAGTAIMGTSDGAHTIAAGARGFSPAWGLSAEARQLYDRRLRQQAYVPKMANYGHLGDHAGWANDEFVAAWLAPLLRAHTDRRTQYASDQAGENSPRVERLPPASRSPQRASDAP